jgi:hypothetical protein
MSWFHRNWYDVMFVTVCALAYVIVRHRDRGRKVPRTSFLAVFAVLATVLNPFFVEMLLHVIGSPRNAGSDLLTFRMVLVALLASVVAVVRIRQSRGALKGMSLAVTGLSVSALWIIGMILTVFALIAGAAAFR